MKFCNDISGKQQRRCRDGARPVSTYLRSASFVMPSFLPHSKNKTTSVAGFDTRISKPHYLIQNKGIREEENSVNSAIKGALQNKGLQKNIQKISVYPFNQSNLCIPDVCRQGRNFYNSSPTFVRKEEIFTIRPRHLSARKKFLQFLPDVCPQGRNFYNSSPTFVRKEEIFTIPSRHLSARKKFLQFVPDG